MSDVFTKRKRSEVMSQIRGRGNKETELALAGLFRKHRITGWRRNQPVFGKPDFVFVNARVAVFVDGCFWHACPKHSNMPANNRAFWRKKLAANRARDLVVNKTLRQAGWRVIRVWEHELGQGRSQKAEERRLGVVQKIRQALEVNGEIAKDRKAR